MDVVVADRIVAPANYGVDFGLPRPVQLTTPYQPKREYLTFDLAAEGVADVAAAAAAIHHKIQGDAVGVEEGEVAAFVPWVHCCTGVAVAAERVDFRQYTVDAAVVVAVLSFEAVVVVAAAGVAKNCCFGAYSDHSWGAAAEASRDPCSTAHILHLVERIDWLVAVVVENAGADRWTVGHHVDY